MTSKIEITCSSQCWAGLAIILGAMLSFAVPAQAQLQGSNTVYSGSTTLVGSNAFIDASTFTGVDICAKINNALLTITGGTLKGGTVIDARGIGPGTTQNCANNPFLPPATAKPAKVLLPSGTITLSHQWIIPDQTQVYGIGPGQTILQAVASFPDVSMIQMGYSNCRTANTNGFTFAVVLAHVTLDGVAQNIEGVDNCNAEEQSYLDDVVMQRVLGINLRMGIDPAGASQGTASHSGPYVNLVFLTNFSGTTTLAGTACVVINQAQPRGLHGITCAAGPASKGGIYLDGDNVSIEDVRIDGFIDGILIGDLTNVSQTTTFAQSDLLFNITGTANVVTNLIRIAATPVNHTSGQPYECPPTLSASANAYSACNITIMGATGGGGTNIIRDDITNTSLAFSSASPAVNTYVLGQQIGNSATLTPNQFSRFTTSPTKATWGVGSVAIVGTPACSAPGALYSNTSGTSTSGTLWTCVTATPNPLWQKVQ